MRNILIALIILLFSGCASKSINNNEMSQIVVDYFNVYSQRNDFNLLMSFYDDNAQFEDIIYGNSLKTKREIKEFLAWDKGEFTALSGGQILTITKQIQDGNTVVTQGFFHEFIFDGQRMGPWLFIIYQEFNSQNKIIKQTDWINYTPREDFLGGKNMNDELIKK
ncbi:hypothetical protein CXF71_10255 [Colwellia sp. 12G3]|nr:hypothetical protein CXF71_10255 [Colwellia sp. 12G3]